MNNKNKGDKMNKFRKIGLTALASSLVAVSAQAAEISVSGASEAGFVSRSNDNSPATTSRGGGDGVGIDTALTFSASGELDNGWTVGVSSVLTGKGAESSSQITLGLGSMGTVVFAETLGTVANGIDDVVPTAFEETWDNSSHTPILQGFGSATNSGAISYRTPTMEMDGATLDLSLDYDPSASAAGAGPNAPSAASTDTGAGSAIVAKMGYEGLSVGVGYEQVNTDSAHTSDIANMTAYAKYTMGPVSAGIQTYELNNGDKGGADHTGETYSVAFNVNDELSISYGVLSETKESIGSTAGVDADVTAIAVAYTMGGLTLGVQQSESDNVDFGTQEGTSTAVSLNFAF